MSVDLKPDLSRPQNKSLRQLNKKLSIISNNRAKVPKIFQYNLLDMTLQY